VRKGYKPCVKPGQTWRKRNLRAAADGWQAALKHLGFCVQPASRPVRIA